MVGVANLLHVDFTAIASESPQPSGDASGTPRPTLEPRPRDQFVLEPIPSPVEPTTAPAYDPGAWLVALEDLPIHSFPSLTMATTATLPAGEASQVVVDPSGYAPDDGLGWTQLQWPYDGWVATVSDGRELAQLYPIEVTTYAGDIQMVTAGSRGFLAAGHLPTRSDEVAMPVLLASSDGAAWSPVGDDLLRYGGVRAMAWGPAGWLVLVSPDDYGYGPYAQLPVAVYRSADGSEWDLLGALPGSIGSNGVEVVGSSFGYLLSQPYGYGSSWFSEDGSAWREMGDMPRATGQQLQVEGVADGFLAWTAGGGAVEPQAVFSVDGRTWQPVESGPSTTADSWRAPMVVQFGSRLVGLDFGTSGERASVWVGAIDGGRLTWRRAPGADDVFADAAIGLLISDGEQALVFGTAADESGARWAGDGTSWARSELPEEMGGPITGAAGPAGQVAVGWRWSLRSGAPLFWHLARDGRYLPESEPFFPPEPDRPDDCGTRPTTFVGVLTRDRTSLLVCFGSAPYTLRAWVPDCDWCHDFGSDGQYDPAWLIEPDDRLPLAPGSTYGDYVFDAVFDPVQQLGTPTHWTGNWVEVTVHLDDPVAASCRYRPGDGQPWQSPPWLIAHCRSTWVVDAIRAVDGP